MKPTGPVESHEKNTAAIEKVFRTSSRFELQQRLAAIVESSNDAIISKTMEGIITSWNKGAERIFGYTAEEMIGQPIFKLVRSGGEDEIIRILERVSRGERVDHYETIRRCKDGREIPVSLTISPIRNAAGQIIGASKIARDISAQKRAEETLRMTEKLAAVGRMASSIAHDINNPLEAITNLLFLLEGEKLSERGKYFLSTAQHELARVSHVAAQSLGFYRKDRKPGLVAVPLILDEALALHRDRIYSLYIEVTRKYLSVPDISCQPGELLQVMVNLIGNALDAMPANGKLQLVIRQATDWRTGRAGLRITITDSGNGMSVETRRRMFEPFYTTKTATGTGLGLWICADIIHQLKGRISVRSSQAPGHNGSAFAVFLPMNKA